jgi:hypothetical protein
VVPVAPGIRIKGGIRVMPAPLQVPPPAAGAGGLVPPPPPVEKK